MLFTNAGVEMKINELQFWKEFQLSGPFPTKKKNNPSVWVFACCPVCLLESDEWNAVALLTFCTNSPSFFVFYFSQGL